MKRCFNIRKLNIFIILLCSICVFCGCGSSDNYTQSNEKDFPQVSTTKKTSNYDCEDYNCVLVEKNETEKKLTFYNRKVKKRYTLSYSGASKFFDKYGSSIVVDQVEPGQLANLTFYKSNKQLNSFTVSADAWEYETIKDFEIKELQKAVTLPDGEYKIDDRLQIFSDGKKIELMDVNSSDVITFRGSGHDIYSIVVEKGHGYLRLKGEEYFIDGWIEVGQKIIKKVTDEMLLTVPEGSYDILLSNEGYKGKKKVTIERDKETELDVSDLVTIDKTKFGTIIIVTDPSEAEIYIDGEEIDITKPQKLEYGIHQLIARAEGYETISQYIKVSQENATLEITLDKEKGPKVTPDPSPNTTPGVIPNVTPGPSPTPSVTPEGQTSSISTSDTGEYKVKIESPADVEVYVDGNYVGIAPVSFAKEEGVHVITLRKEGFSPRSYTISLDATSENETFSFSELGEVL